MKSISLLILSLLLSSSLSRAQTEPVAEATSPSSSSERLERHLTDLIYLPPPGLLELGVIWRLEGQVMDVESGGLHTKTLTKTSSKFSLDVVGGIADWLSAGFRLGLGSEIYKSKDELSGVEDEAKARGFSNPEFFFDARALDFQKGAPLDLVFGLTYIPKMGTPKMPTSTDDGNLLNVDDVFSVRVGAYRKWEQLEGVLLLKYTPSIRGNRQSASTGIENDVKMPSLFETKIGIQHKFNEFWLGSAGLKTLSYGEDEINSLKTDEYAAALLTLGAKFILTPEKSYLAGNLELGAAKDHKANNGADKIKKNGLANLDFAYVIEF